MTAAIRESINQLIAEASAQINSTPADVLELVLVANPIMHHLFLGISPLELGGGAVCSGYGFIARPFCSGVGA